MFYQIAGIARDSALILLVIEALVLSLIPLLAFYYLNRGLRQLLPKVTPAFRQAQTWLVGFRDGVEQVMGAIAAPFMWLNTTMTACSRALTKVSERSLRR